jgi:HSP20 family protein
MAIVRWSPSNDLAGLHSSLDRLFGDVFGEMYGPMERGNGGGREGARDERPTLHLPVNISETDRGYRIEAPVPGFKPEDVEVTFEDGMLTINAQRRKEESKEEGNMLRREVAFGHYRRQISLPGDIRADDIKAAFEHGVLTIDVPRAPRPQPKRIPIAGRGNREESKQLAGAGSSSKRN